MSRKNDFKEFLKLKQQPTKAKAIELCGQAFIDELTIQKIFAKDELFWARVCEKLNVPEYQKQRQLRAEQEEIEKEKLLANLKLFEKRSRKGWEVLIYELPDSDIFGKKYAAIAQKEDETIEHIDTFYWGNTPNQAFGRICSPIDSREDRIQKNVEFQNIYSILKPIYLLFLYISGNDDYSYSLSGEKHKENFIGMQSWIKLRFEILDFLEQEGLIEQSQKKGNNPRTVTYVDITKKGMRQAREILGNIKNLEGVEKFLKKYEYHEDYINHKNEQELMQKEHMNQNLADDLEVK